MVPTFLLHILQVHILSECCDRTDQSACVFSGKMAPLLMTYFSLLQSATPAMKSHLAICFRHLSLIFLHMYTCVQAQTYKIPSLCHKQSHQLYTWAHQTVSYKMSHTIIDGRTRRSRWIIFLFFPDVIAP